MQGRPWPDGVRYTLVGVRGRGAAPAARGAGCRARAGFVPRRSSGQRDLYNWTPILRTKMLRATVTAAAAAAAVAAHSPTPTSSINLVPTTP
eukprot:COSAG02_NODE_8428_length_2573_cov_2.352061_1_plen_91_part_10